MMSTPQAEGRVMGRRFVLTLLIGIWAGFSFAYLVLTSTGYTRETWPMTHRDLNKQPLANVLDHGNDEPAHRNEDHSVADELAKKVRVLCWVMTQPKNHEMKAKPVKATWGKRCNVLLFMSTEEDESLPSIKLPVHEGRDYLWGKTKAAFRYIYEHHRRDADWFLKADDDTSYLMMETRGGQRNSSMISSSLAVFGLILISSRYVIVENLRYMLAEHDSTSPVYFGCRFKPFTKQGYMSGGAGYVLSREALDQFVNKALPSPHLCKVDDTGAEDAEMGKCLDNIGVTALDSRDSLQRGRFFPFAPANHLFPNRNAGFWYWRYIYYPSSEGLDCCSDHAISFHYVNPQLMYTLDYLIYHLRPYGISQIYRDLPTILRNHTVVEPHTLGVTENPSNR